VGDQIQNKEMGGACSTYGGKERCTQGFGGGDERKRQFVRTKCRREGNIKIGLQEVG